MTPPWLFGWSSYQPEGLLVTCSWDYTSRNLSNRLYYVFLLVFGFVLPVAVLTFCYSSILCFILRSSRDITRLVLSNDGVHFSNTTMSFLQRRKQKELRTALIILSLALLYVTAWTPYAVVSLIGQFGPVDDDGRMRLSPLTVSIPAFFAKSVIALNPLVYVFTHPQFCSSVRILLRDMGISTRNGNRASMMPMVRMTNNPRQSPLASPAAFPSPSIDRKRDPTNSSTPSTSSVHPQSLLNILNVRSNHVVLRRGIIIFYIRPMPCMYCMCN